MDPNRSKSSPDMAAEEDPSGFCLKQPLRSDSDALGLGKSGLEKKRSLLIKQGQMDYSNPKQDPKADPKAFRKWGGKDDPELLLRDE